MAFLGNLDGERAVPGCQKLMGSSRYGGERATNTGPTGVPERAVPAERQVLEGDGEVLEVRAWRQSESGGCGGADLSCRRVCNPGVRYVMYWDGSVV